MKKLFNFQWSFLTIDIRLKNKTPIIFTERLGIVIYLWKTFLQTESFFIVWNEKQIIFVLGGTGSMERKLLHFKKAQAKILLRMQKLYQTTYIFCNTLWSVLIHPFDTNLLPPRETLGLHCIFRAQLFTWHIYLATLPLTWQLCYKPPGILPRQIKNRCIYLIKVFLRYF